MVARLNTNVTPEPLRLFCDKALPAHLASFVSQARASALPFVDGEAWHLCDIISRDDTLLQRWIVRQDAQLVDSLAETPNDSLLEFYTQLSRARLGSLEHGLMPVDSGERLILGIMEVALLGQPASVVSLVRS